MDNEKKEGSVLGAIIGLILIGMSIYLICM